MEKMAWDGPKWGREDFFLTNPDLANILGRTDLDFENCYLFHFVDTKFLDSFWAQSVGQGPNGWPKVQRVAHGPMGGQGGQGHHRRSKSKQSVVIH